MTCRYYIITGRITGWDEDTVHVLYQKSEADAEELFIALLLDEEGLVLGPDDDNHVVINHVAVSDTNITLLRVGPQ